MRFPPRFLDDVKSRVSIYDYARPHLQWDRGKTRPGAGDYWAPCPFHPEKTASFHVLDRQGAYKCFGCGAGGDIFGLCMQLEGLSFPEAVERLAASAGIALPEGENGHDKAQDEIRKRQYAALEKAAAFFRARLRSPAGQAVRDYLARRQIPEDAWEQFGLGFAPDGWSATYDALTASGLRREDLYTIGLAKDGAHGPIDLFRNRLMFPIHDPQGRIIGFGGRTLEADGKPKYINSPETPLFHKGRTLYRLGQARRLLAKTRAEGLVVGEGYMDVVAFERAGVAAVAPLGTALTEDQMALAWRSGAAPVICLDGDAAGLRAAEKALALALPQLSPEKTLRFARLPPKMDPDDVFRRDGPEALAALIAAALPAADFLFETEVARVALTTPEARAGLKRRLREACGRITDPDTRENYLKDMLSRADAALRESQRPAWTPAPQSPNSPKPPRPGFGGMRGRGFEAPVRVSAELKTVAGKARRSALEDALRMAADRPSLLEAGADRLALLTIADSDLNAIRHGLLDLWSAGREVDRGSLSRHLQANHEERAHVRIVHWPPPVAPRKARSKEVGALEGAQAPSAPSPGQGAPEGDPGQTEAEWMALLAQHMAIPELNEDLEAAKLEALEGDDDAAFARYQALLSARRTAQASPASGVDVGGSENS
jgi:DNA primase